MAFQDDFAFPDQVITSASPKMLTQRQPLRLVTRTDSLASAVLVGYLLLTALELGWHNLPNGELLQAAEAYDFCDGMHSAQCISLPV